MSQTDIMERSKNLNGLSCSQVMLFMLRTLAHSDGLVSSFQCLKEETVRDICNVADGILQTDCGDEMDPVDHSRMTVDEKAEYLIIVEMLRIYGGHDA